MCGSLRCERRFDYRRVALNLAAANVLCLSPSLQILIWHHRYECFNLSPLLAQYVLKGDFMQISFRIDLTF